MDKNQAVSVNKIPHVRYDENGNVIEQFEVESPNFTDDKNIYLTTGWFKERAKHGHKGDVTQSNFANIGKTVWYRAEGQPDRQIVAMEILHQGVSLKVTLQHANGGGQSVLTIPVE